MTLIDKLAIIFACRVTSNQRNEACFKAGFKKGFQEAKEIALQIWISPGEHTYCDFYYRGMEEIKNMSMSCVDTTQELK